VNAAARKEKGGSRKKKSYILPSPNTFTLKTNTMKKTFLIAAAALLLGFTISAFTLADGTKQAEQYCMVTGTRALLSNKVTITVDYGQPTKWLTDNRIKDETGKVEKFNSMIDALNYMTNDGWTFVCAYPITMGNSLVYVYTMKKVVPVE
jgi:hypothetical protein